MSASDHIFDQAGKTPRDLIQEILYASFVVDYGIVKTVNSNGTVDVIHAVKIAFANGTTLEETVTHGIQVLWPSTSELSFKTKLVKGDRVLLVGLKYSVPDVDISASKAAKEYFHYSQETLKAIPLCVFSSDSKVTISVEDGKVNIESNADITIDMGIGKMAIKNSLASLYTVLSGLIDTISAAITVGSAATQVLDPSTQAALAVKKTELGNVLKG